ncbi:MAG TPA: hypothetical protein VJP40_08675 [bacterium]|nr:hypothetical protein [bacterium]
MSKSKVSKNKKILLGSALAGLVMAGPGLSVTTGSASAGKFFQSAELEVGYRVAQAAEEKKVVAAATPAPADPKKDADKHCSGDMKCGGDKKCGAAGKHCGGDKKPSATPAATDKKSDTSKSCGAGACGGHK